MHSDTQIEESIKNTVIAMLKDGSVADAVKIAIMAAHRVHGRTGNAVTEGAALVAVDCALDAARYALDEQPEMAARHVLTGLQAARDVDGQAEALDQIRAFASLGGTS